MNTTNQTLEHLQQLCDRHDLRLLPRQPLCRQTVIDAIAREIRRLHSSPAASASIHSGDHVQWKQKLETLQSHLTDLRQPENPTPLSVTSVPSVVNPQPHHPPTVSAHGVPASAGSHNKKFSPQFALANVDNGHPSCGGLGKPILDSQFSINPPPASVPSVSPPQTEHPPTASSPHQPARPQRRHPDPTVVYVPEPPKPPAIPPFPASSRQNLEKRTPLPKSQIINRHSSIINPPETPQSAPPSDSAIRTPQPAIAPNPQLRLAKILQAATARKPRPDDKLAALSEDARQQLLDWLQTTTNTYDDVVELAAKPISEGGLDVHTSRSALHRFFQNHDLHDRLQSAIDILEAADPGADLTQSFAPSLEQTLELLVHAQSIRVAGNPDLRGSTLHHFLRHLDRFRDRQLRERNHVLQQKRLAFKMQSFHFDAVAEAMKKLPELNEIAANRDLTPRQLFEKGYIKIFGQEAHDMIQAANRKYAEQHPEEPTYEPDPELELASMAPKMNETEIFRLMNDNPDTPIHILKTQHAHEDPNEPQPS